MTDEWIRQLAERLDLEAPTQEETSRLLAAARDVAHGVERRITPLSTFLLGRAVQARIARGAERTDALAEVLGMLEDEIPEETPDQVP
ncbi:MAG: DUF6457 domain-containing protein [Actinomycetota bacterium]